MWLKIFKYILFIILFFQAVECREAQERGMPVFLSNPYLNALILDYDHYVDKALSDGLTPGVAVAIVYDTSVVFIKGYGTKVYGLNDSIDIHSVFRLGSVSKGFASFLTGLLVQEGVLNWDDKVVKYLPDFSLKSKEPTCQLSIRNVLSHTTGLPYHSYTNLIEEGWKLPDMIHALKDVEVIGPVGTIYSYQNVAYSIIEEVLKSVTGLSYVSLMKEHVFRPMKMSDASMSYKEIVNEKDFTKPHFKYKGTWKPQKIHDTYYNASPAGGVNASITDMAQYLRALLGNNPEVIADSTLSTLFTPEIRTSRYKYLGNWKHLKKAYYGLGWRVFETVEDTIIYHGGYVNGYRSEIALIPDKKVGICVLTNASNRFSSKSLPEFFDKFSYWYDSIDSWQKRNTNPYYVIKRNNGMVE